MSRDLPSGTVTFLFTDIEGSTQAAGRARRPLRRGARGTSAAAPATRSRTRAASRSTPRATPSSSCSRLQATLCGPRRGRSATSRRTTWPETFPVRVRMGLHTGEPGRIAEGYVGAGRASWRPDLRGGARRPGARLAVHARTGRRYARRRSRPSRSRRAPAEGPPARAAALPADDRRARVPFPGGQDAREPAHEPTLAAGAADRTGGRARGGGRAPAQGRSAAAHAHRSRRNRQDPARAAGRGGADRRLPERHLLRQPRADRGSRAGDCDDRADAGRAGAGGRDARRDPCRLSERAPRPAHAGQLRAGPARVRLPCPRCSTRHRA